MARHIPKEAFIIVTVLLFILDILHIFLMTLVIRREKHNTSLRSIEHKIIITKKKGTQYKSPVRIHF
ncbi:hypothetical protein FACS189459_5480 [Bacilli bacterium]|nr:hypothetical protein FACS189459_5480 [Bacilli bacterium]